MKFKEIAFEDHNSNRIYRDYINRVKTTVKALDMESQQEILLEINSHIYEGISFGSETKKEEVERLLDVLERLGQPEVFLKSLVAEKKMEEATRSFNPLKIAKALILNIGNGFSYILFAFLYLCLFGFAFLIVAKLIDPENVGLFYRSKEVLVLGLYKDPSGISYSEYEQLGNWFIPVMGLSAAVLYVILTLLLKLKRSSRKRAVLKNPLTLLLCLMVSSLAYTQQIDTAKLNAYFTALEQNNKFMGSVAVSQNGQLIYSKTIGFSDVENKTKANENSKYRIGSISKTFTSVLILKAVEAKKLKLDQPIKKFFPTIQNADQITIRHLLSHRSGIHDFTEDADYLSWNTQPKTEKEMVDLIAKGGSDFKPDSTAAYCNSNYVLLTYILEKTTKESYEKLLEKYIVKPLGLKNTCLGGKINPAANECRSYAFEDTWKVSSETDSSIPLGAGGIVSTSADLVKFSDALFGGNLLQKESLELMKTLKENFGLGLFQMPFYDKIGFGHRGGIDEFTSAFSYFQDGGISFAILSNGMNYNGNEVPLAVLSAIYQKPFDVPDFSVYEVNEQVLETYLGIYSSEQVPIKITITKEGKTLIAQATNQSANELEASGKDKFRFVNTGIVLEFSPEEKTMLLKQGGAEFLFIRE